MSIDIQNETAPNETAPPPTEPRMSFIARVQHGLTEVDWRWTLLTALVMAVLWCLLFLMQNVLQILAGIIPVTAGLFLGRKVKRQLALHGVLLGLIGYTFGAIIVGTYGGLGALGIVPLPLVQSPETGNILQVGATDLVLFYLSFSALAMIPFPAFGAIMGGRAEQRQRQMREQIEMRGGQLERHAPVRLFDDLQGLSLPQFGMYVSDLYRKHGFTLTDYKFLHKDKHLDLELEYQGEIYLARLSVEDKVRPGIVQSLVQDMQRRGIKKGIVLTSTEFMPDVRKAIKSGVQILLIDGKTLFEMAQ